MAKKLDKVDAVIVGSGWAGGVSASELAKKGYKVVILERGKDQKSEDFIGAKDELRYDSRNEMMQDLTKETITSRNYLDETALPIRENSSAVFGNDTGGASVHWHGICNRWYPYDFEIHSKTVERYGEDKIPKGMTIQDWGITYDELEPYYDQFEKIVGVSGEESPMGPPRSMEYPNPPMKETPSLRLFKEATKELGYHPAQSASANMSEQYENPDGEVINQCVYCAFCDKFGCDFGAKSDPIVTVLATAEKTGNSELRNHAYVTRVIHDGKKAIGVQYTDTQTGEVFEQPADIVVLAGFTFTNNKLLMVSEIGEPYNPETKEGIIGKNFTGQDVGSTYIPITGYFEDKKFNNFMGSGALGAMIEDFAADNMDHTDLNFIHGFEVAIHMHGDRPIINNPVPEGTPSWGREFKEKSLHYANRRLGLGIEIGAMPWDHNYLDLDPTYKDAFGNPLLRVTKKYTEQDREAGRKANEIGIEIMEKMGADIVEGFEVSDEAEFHHIYNTAHYAGGVIMGESPDNSAVNNYSQMWEMDNLFVLGGSSFPHFGTTNPTITIGALACRAAEGMDEYLKNGDLLVEAKSEVNRA